MSKANRNPLINNIFTEDTQYPDRKHIFIYSIKIKIEIQLEQILEIETRLIHKIILCFGTEIDCLFFLCGSAHIYAVKLFSV